MMPMLASISMTAVLSLTSGSVSAQPPVEPSECPTPPRPREAPLEGPSTRSSSPPLKDPMFSDAGPPQAPAKPVPWVKSPFIFIAQVVGGFGMRMLLMPCMLFPVVGPAVSMVVGPLAEAFGVTWAGDRLGDGRAPLLAPWLASVLVGGSGALLVELANGVVLGVMVLNTLVATPELLAALNLPQPNSNAFLLISVGLLAMSVAVSAATLLGNVLLTASPFVATALYQFTKTRKAPEDNGTGWVHVLPRRGASRSGADPANGSVVDIKAIPPPRGQPTGDDESSSGVSPQP